MRDYLRAELGGEMISYLRVVSGKTVGSQGY
jgi:hypothetical protein